MQKGFKTVLSIAGVDPSGGAGIFADFRAIEAVGVRALGAVTALTVQTEKSFTSYEPTGEEMLRQTIRSMIDAFPGSVVKTGMLPTAETVGIVADMLDELDVPAVVIDPVIVASVGARLVDEASEAAIRDQLVQRATLLTPNMHEAAALTGNTVETLGDMHRAAEKLLETGAEAVVLTGGHLQGDAVDVLATEKGIIEIRAERLPGSVHGTGCSFASRCAAELALGRDLEEAVRGAKDFIADLFRQQRWRAE